MLAPYVPLLLLTWWMHSLHALVVRYREHALSLEEGWANAMRIAVAQQIAILHRIPEELRPGTGEELQTMQDLLQKLNRDYPPRRPAPPREDSGQRFQFLN